MKIAVISDTHIPSAKSELPPKLLKSIAGADMIMHAGDIILPSVIDELSTIAPVEAVLGNMDHYMGMELPIKRVLRILGHRIGMIHGYGSPAGIVQRIRMEFKEVSCIVFGHTHSPMNKVMDNILFFNPGSPTDKRFAKNHTFGMLNVTEESLTGEIITI